MMNVTEAKEALKQGKRITAAAGVSKDKVFCKLCHGGMIMLVQPDATCSGTVIGVRPIDKLAQNEYEIYQDK